jgi:glycosyltransferase involved in cell wall biosynthesis
MKKNCKKILPWTETIKKDIISVLPEIKNKIEVVNPAVPFPQFKKRKNPKITILYASRYFWIKGGLVALETLKRIQERYDVKIIFISEVPKEVKEKYKEINIQGLVSHEKMIENYKNSDIFFYPSFLDTFGFSLLEAMSYGLSILTVNTGGTKNCGEIIDDARNGLVVDFPYYQGNEIYKKCHSLGDEEEKLIDSLFKKLSFLIENSKKRKELFKNCRDTIKNGKFSIQKRNEKLSKIYSEALK